MSSLTKRWTFKKADENEIRHLQDVLNLQATLCRLLIVRGIKTYDEAKAFFRPQLSDLHDPFLMKDMAQAVERISKANIQNEAVLVYGDYDVDGTTAVAVVYSFLKEHHQGNLQYYIPHRYREGYGLSRQGIDFAHENGFSLIITLDCGIKSVELVDYANSLGIDVIICDHHTPDSQLPKAVAILNPKQADCNYPYKELSGCGIGFKLITALARKLNLEENSFLRYLDLVATSIAADIVPIDGENRILAYYGVKKVNEDPLLPLKVLKELSGTQKELSVADLVFVIGPRVNAAGRMDDAKKAVQLFVEKDLEEINKLAHDLQSDNTERKEVDKTITEQALAIIRENEDIIARKSTVLYKEDWHKGVVGIVASRLLDHYYRPTIVLTQSNGKVSGSARSISGFNIYDAIFECRDLLENFGGHFYAAGMTLLPENVEAFIKKFEEVVTTTIPPQLLIPEIEIDAEIQLKDITPSFYNIIHQFEPFGPANMRPVFYTSKVRDYKGYSRIVKEQHVKFIIQEKSGKIMDGIGFNMAEKFPIVAQGDFDVVYTIDKNSFNGETKLQIKVIDVKAS